MARDAARHRARYETPSGRESQLAYKHSERGKAKRRAWQEANRERRRAQQREYTRSEVGRAKRMAYAQSERGRRIKRDGHYRRRYGISIETYDRILASQGGLCAICDGEPNGRWKRPHVDHSHDTGEVRGILCNSCNVLLGQYEKAIRVPGLMAYLARYAEGPQIPSCRHERLRRPKEPAVAI